MESRKTTICFASETRFCNESCTLSDVRSPDEDRRDKISSSIQFSLLSFFFSPRFCLSNLTKINSLRKDENKTSSVVWTTAAAGRESRILFSYYFFVLASVSHGRSRGTYSRPTNASLSPFYYFQKVSDDDDWSVEINVSSNIPSASVTRRRDRTTHLEKKRKLSKSVNAGVF